VLLVQRAHAPNAGIWTLPGGRQHFGETLEAAVKREVFEETGLRLIAPVVCDALDVMVDAHGAVAVHYVIVVFAGLASVDEVRLNGELGRFTWVEMESAGELATTTGLMHTLARAASVIAQR
jgi:8-oxo-dGTP pyrophosphatase MutT (NUDIX family)